MKNKSASDNQDKQLVVVRDVLAGQRTALANERTFMAVIRTFLSLLAAGMALLKLFEHTWAAVLGSIMLLASLAVMSLGGWNYFYTRKLLREELKSWEEEAGL